MRIGATHLLEEHGSRLAVAEKLLEGKLDSFAQQFVSDIVDSTLLEAAQFDALSDSRFNNPYINIVLCQQLINVLRTELGMPIPPETPEESYSSPYKRRRKRMKLAQTLIQECLDTIAMNASPEWRERAEAFLKEDTAAATSEEEGNG